ncbi:hypothetical protein ASPCAL10417 [Aspergillus calidoustus]|uniref:Thioester reductase (TE) domain-containing protein n=1 Tax=Aspergillus calidoustus TaxID=454130 RepID=A0A0U5G6B2_ASPCI|nr:hypothetical protein ASPCAL10417 [Aspergillus calidoustus]
MNQHIPTSKANNIPEEILTTTSTASTGYGNSKYLAEHIIDHAVKTQHLRASVARVGQIAAAVNGPGAWKREGWLPSLMQSSLWLGALPNSLGPVLDRVDWVPVDLLAAILVEMALEFSQPVVPGVGKDTGVERRLSHRFLPLTLGEMWRRFRKWIERIRQDLGLSSDDGSDGNGDGQCPQEQEEQQQRRFSSTTAEELLHTTLEQNAAVKLVRFFEDLVVDDADDIKVFETTRAVQRSKKLRNVSRVSAEWVKKWIDEMLDDGEAWASPRTGKS